MRKLSSFTQVSLDGYFVDAKGDMSWAKPKEVDEEWQSFVGGNAGSGGELLFGRVTYQMMAAFWPSPAAAQMDPKVAGHINALPKIVFSRTLEKAEWNNTRLIKSDLVEGVRRLKQDAGPHLVVLGSGSVVSQLAQAGLVDEFQMVVNPVVLGKGRTPFETVTDRLKLKLARSRTFRNGNVLVCYEPA